LAATGNLTLSGNNVQIKGTQVGIEAIQDLKIKTMDTSIEAQVDLSLKGTSLNMNANASAKLTGGATTEVSSSGFMTIKGSLVNIN
jgi:type VI secretion system secreted protein VgrG